MEKICRAVERVDNPAMLTAGIHQSSFFHKEGVSGPRLVETVAQNFLRLQVSLGHKVSRPLAGNLKVFDLTKVTGEGSSGLGNGGYHDVEKSGTGHGRSCVAGRKVRLVGPGGSVNKSRSAGRFSFRPGEHT